MGKDAWGNEQSGRHEKSPLDEPMTVGPDGMLPWLQTPRTKEQYEELTYRMGRLARELETKGVIVASQLKHAITRPRGDSKWAQAIAFARIDLRWYADGVARPIARSGAAASAVAKAYHESFARFLGIYEVLRAKERGQSSGGGFKF